MNRFQMGSKLGEGQFGVVFAAIRTQTRKEVAIKIFKEAVDSWEEMMSLREIMCVTHIPPHPNIVSVPEVHLNKVFPTLVMERCDGSLLDLMDEYKTSNKRIEEPLIRSMLREILMGIRHCHESNVVHRDVKPENILFRREGSEPMVCKLGDFGLARRLPRGSLNYCPGMQQSPPMTSYISTRW